MKTTINSFGLMLAAATIAFAPAAYAEKASAENQGKFEHKDNGGYTMKGSASETLPSGTKKSAETKVDVDIDDDGNMTKTTEKETVTNPEGLMNEKRTVTKTEFEEDDDGGYESETVAKHTNADGTDKKTKTSLDVDVDSDGKVTKKKKVVNTTDPKGLFNQEKAVTTTKTVNGKVVEQKTER